MKVTVIGAGNMGSAFVTQLTRARHEVTKRHATQRQSSTAMAANPAPERLRRWCHRRSGRGRTGHRLCRCRYPACSLGELANKVVIDIHQPMTADYVDLTIGHDTSAAEEIAKAVPGAEAIKAFNTVFAQVLPKVPDPAAARSPSSLPATARQGKRQGHWPKAWVSTPSTPGLKNASLPRASLAA